MGRKVTRVEKNRTAPKKSWDFKGGKVGDIKTLTQ